MTRQEKIREGVARIGLGGINPLKNARPNEYGYKIADEILQYLHSQDIVIKVDNNTTDFIKCPCDDCTATYKLIDEWGYFCDLACGKRSHWLWRQMGWKDVTDAGYVAWKPLTNKRRQPNE